MTKGETTKKPRSPRGPTGRERTAAARAGTAAARARKREAAMAAILTALRAGATRKAASAAGRVSHEAFYSWFREAAPCRVQQADGTIEEIPFPLAVEQAEAQAVLFYEATVRKAAVEAEHTFHYDREGNLLREVVKYDWRAAAWWLEHHPTSKDEFRAVQRAEVTGPGGGPIQTEGVVVFRPDPAWLAEYAASLADLPPEIATPMLGPGSEKPPEDRG